MATDNKKKGSGSDRQSAFAGTNPDKYGQPRPADEQDNPIDAGEAQNVTDGQERISGEDADRARNKANEGKK